MLYDNIKPNQDISRLLIGRVHTNIKITNNTKINRIMISFSDQYNSIFIYRVSHKHKIGSFMVF